MNGLTAFELYLMSLMRGQAKIAPALGSLGISADSMREAADRMEHVAGFLDFTAREIDAYTGILGAPIEITAEPGIGPDESFSRSQRYRFHLPLWPSFDLILRAHPAGWIWGPEFVRRSGVPVPEVDSVRELEPWTIAESEVISRFGPFASEEAWNLGKDATYVVEEAGERVEINLAFDLALLQGVDVVPAAGSQVSRAST
jgi:hypothetical protein